MSHSHENGIVSESCETDDSERTSGGGAATGSTLSTSRLGRRQYVGLLGGGVLTSLLGSRSASADGTEAEQSGGDDTARPSGGFAWDETFTDTS